MTKNEATKTEELQTAAKDLRDAATLITKAAERHADRRYLIAATGIITDVVDRLDGYTK